MNNDTITNADLADLLGANTEASKKAVAEEKARCEREQALLDVIIHNGCLTRAEKDAALDKLRAAFRDRVEAVNCKACGKSFEDTILAPADYDSWDYGLSTPFGDGNTCHIDVSGIPGIVIASILDADRRLLASFAIAIAR